MDIIRNIISTGIILHLHFRNWPTGGNWNPPLSGIFSSRRNSDAFPVDQAFFERAHTGFWVGYFWNRHFVNFARFESCVLLLMGSSLHREKRRTFFAIETWSGMLRRRGQKVYPCHTTPIFSSKKPFVKFLTKGSKLVGQSVSKRTWANYATSQNNSETHRENKKLEVGRNK